MKTFFLSFFVYLSCVNFSGAQAYEKLTIENNTDATLWIFYQKSGSVSEAVSIPPGRITVLENYLPNGRQTVYLETRYLKTPRTATRQFYASWENETGAYWAVTNQTFGVRFMSDPPGAAMTDQPNNANSNTACKWVQVGQGDVAYHDINGSATHGSSIPSNNMCNSKARGLGAVCWSGGDPWCTYKDIPVAQITGGGKPGALYECQCSN